jgi:hypothetical protein
MSDSKDVWPMPHYNPGPVKHMHALGVISVQYNKLEELLFGLFRHHLEVAGIHFSVCEKLYGQLENNKRRLETIKLIFSFYDKEDAVKEHIDYFTKYFNICYENRNVLMHSNVIGGHASPQTELLSIHKHPKND